MTRKKMTISERLVRIETLLSNHLKHHDTILKFVMCPIIIGIVMTVLKLYVFK